MEAWNEKIGVCQNKRRSGQARGRHMRAHHWMTNLRHENWSWEC